MNTLDSNLNVTVQNRLAEGLEKIPLGIIESRKKKHF